MNARWLVTVAMVAGAVGLGAANPDLGVRYQLEFSAELTRTEGVGRPVVTESRRLSGAFRLVETVGPLDWGTYAVEQVVLTATGKGGDSGAPLVLAGSGWYQRGGRGDSQEKMTLTLDVGGRPLEVASGLVPANEDWPALAVVLKGSRSAGADGTGREAFVITLNAVPGDRVTRHRLLPESTFTDACAVCGRPGIAEPITGHYDLALIDENPLISRFAVLDVRFLHRPGDAILRTLIGGGRYRFGGEVAVRHPMRLDLEVFRNGEGRQASLNNDPAAPWTPWPMVGEDLLEEGGTHFSTFQMRLRSAPVRALWFTTSNGMTPGTFAPPVQRLEGGDLLDDAGRVVKPLSALLAALALVPDTAARLDAFTIAPGGEVWFSLAEDTKSETLGLIQEGDVVSDRGRRVFTNQELTGRLSFMPVVPDLGLDGLQLLPDGEVWFSTRQDQFSETLGVVVSNADIVSAKGTVVLRGRDLLAAFKPEGDSGEIGLDAFFVWPGGEVWFSTAVGFQSGIPEIGGVMDGDLLSSEGRIIYRNLDLVREFQPLEDLANFGLTGIFVVTDLTATAGSPTLKWRAAGADAWEVSWAGPGRVFQVEATGDWFRPFAEKTPIGLETTYRWRPGGTEFLRVRQW